MDDKSQGTAGKDVMSLFDELENSSGGPDKTVSGSNATAATAGGPGLASSSGSTKTVTGTTGSTGGRNARLLRGTGAKRNAAAFAAGGSTGASSTGTTTPKSGQDNSQEVLDFLDEISGGRSTASGSGKAVAAATGDGKMDEGTAPDSASGPTASAATSSSTAPSGRSRDDSLKTVARTEAEEEALSDVTTQPTGERGTLQPDTSTPGSSLAPDPGSAKSWGWGSIWSSASTALASAKVMADDSLKRAQEVASSSSLESAVDEKTKKKWTEAFGSSFDRLGNDLKSTLGEIINAVAPPISEHEVVQVWLSHDMVGYDGVDHLVYTALAKVMEQAGRSDLVVNRGSEDTPTGNVPDDERSLNPVTGFVTAWKLARANLDAQVKLRGGGTTRKEESAGVENVTECPIYMRIQPTLAPMPYGLEVDDEAAWGISTPKGDLLFFLVLLHDPQHGLSHSTITQPIPGSWLEIPFEENEWVEETMVDILRKGLEVVAKEYVDGRMTGRRKAVDEALARG